MRKSRQFERQAEISFILTKIIIATLVRNLVCLYYIYKTISIFSIF
jgi:hypothetical protein